MRSFLLLLGCVIAVFLTTHRSAADAATSPVVPADVLAPPTLDELHQAVEQWIVQRRLEQTPLKDAMTPLWEFDHRPSAEELFDALLRTFYLADEQTRELIDSCRQWRYSPALLNVHLPQPGKADRTRPSEPLYVHNVRYFLARHLTLLTAYNEALEIFQTTDPHYVVDPAGYLFHRAVCEHHLLMKKEGLATLKRLTDQTEDVPVRYQKLAELMQRDLDELEEKSLGEVARQMKDVERRLSLQRTDKGVQMVEERIVATLDELIKKLEDQQNQSSSSSSGQSTGQPPTNPASDSYLGGMKGPGETDKRDIGHKDHWGDLPPKAREAAKNMLNQQFPAHYRQAVEEYLKKLAERPAPTP